MGIAPRGLMSLRFIIMRKKTSIFMLVCWVFGSALFLATYFFVTHLMLATHDLLDLKRLAGQDDGNGAGLSAKSLVADFSDTPEGQSLVIRARRYADLSQKTHIVDGMVVDRDDTGKFIHQCDSLLFSSLRYVALERLGFHDLSRPAWEAIQKSRTPKAGWLRHPRCPETPLSRDMIMGILAALSQSPQNAAQVMQWTREDLHRFDGYISDGPFYISFFSPGFRAAFDEMAMVGGEPSSGLAWSFWTTEFDAWTADGDYRSHLVALTIWLEFEIEKMGKWKQRSGSTIDPVAFIVDPWMNVRLRDLRLAWSAQTLLRTDPDNLFFHWLALKSVGALSPQRRVSLANLLLGMPAFPEDRLPTNCDRRADYVWQRPSSQTRERRAPCSEVFSGTDFLWMSALLLENP